MNTREARKVNASAITSADILGCRFHVNFKGKDYLVVGSGSRFDVCEGGETVGFVRIGSSRSGAIWTNGDCIADYGVDEGRNYLVVPIDNGFRQPERALRVDPLLHLLESLHSEAS